MNLKELSQVGLAYQMRSRVGVTAGLSRLAETAKIPFEEKTLSQLSDQDFWKFVQGIIDRILHSAQEHFSDALRQVRNA